jgi:hypothetical protein
MRSKKGINVPVQKLLCSIDIFEDAIVASRYGDGRVYRRFITPSILAEMCKKPGDTIKQWMPLFKNVVAVGTDTNGYQRYLVIRPAKRTRIICHIGKRKFKQVVAMPNLLAELIAEKTAKGPRFKSIASIYAFGGQVSKLNADTQLYVAPVPNVHSNGSICMGNVNVKRWANLNAAEVFEKAFIRTPFTGHALKEPLTAAASETYRNIIDALEKRRGNIPLQFLKKVKKYGDIFKE